MASIFFYSIGALRKKHTEGFTENLTNMFNLLAQGKIKPVIAACLPLTEVKRAHEDIETAAVQGKIVLTM
jgi:NADPH:quinone reductase-like Zn-dependent oxidoreductase